MIFGGCPYCNESVSCAMPDGGPYWAKSQCESCGKEFWRWLTRINPQAWTVEDFDAIYVVDESTKKVSVREGKTDVVGAEYDAEGKAMAVMLGIDLSTPG